MTTTTTPIRRLLLVDAALCAVSGIALVAAGEPFAELLRSERPGAVRIVGALLLVVAADIALITRLRDRLLPSMTVAVVGVNAAWVIATLALVAAGVFTTAGAALAVGSAALVGSLAWKEWEGVSELRAPVPA